VFIFFRAIRENQDEMTDCRLINPLVMHSENTTLIPNPLISIRYKVMHEAVVE